MSEDIINHALQNAKYNELVELQVSVDDGGDDINNGNDNNTASSSQQQKIVLVATLDQINGGIQWTNLTNNNNEEEDTTSNNENNLLLKRHLMTKRWIFPMLNDHKRNNLYDIAIRRAVKKHICNIKNASTTTTTSSSSSSASDLPSSPPASATTRTINCLDIGSGTGLLAMLTTKYLKDSGYYSSIQTTTIEMSTAMVEIATKTIEDNNLSEEIQIVEGHSCNIANNVLNPKAEICTSELLDSQLLGEGWIPTMRDAWERHLSSNAIVIPQRARIYTQIVESTNFLSNYWGPYNKNQQQQQQQQNSFFPNGRSLKFCTSNNNNDVLLGCGGDDGDGGGVLLPIHIRSLLEKKDIRLLSDPILSLEIDVSSKESVPKPGSHQYTKSFVPIARGKAQGVIFWWELDLFDDNDGDNKSGDGGSTATTATTTTYSTHHEKGPFQDHWQQCAYIFGKRKEECLQLEKDIAALLIVRHNDTGISFDVAEMDNDDDDDDDNNNTSNAKRFKTMDDEKKSPSYIAPMRAWQLNDWTRTEIFISGIRSALDVKGMDAIVLDVSDFSLGAMIAALLGGKCVTSLEASIGTLPEMTARIAQIGNGLPLKCENGGGGGEDGGTNDCIKNLFEIVRCHPEQLTRDVLGGLPATIVVAEPYYEVLEGWHLQEALNYFYLIRGLKNRGVLVAGEGFIAIPTYAKVMACAFQSSDIASSYCKCKPKICGFDHTTINCYCQFDKHDALALPTWQYNIVPMTEPFEIANINYEQVEMNDDYEASSNFSKVGTCSGIVIWIEYGVRVGEDVSIVSTKGRPCNQIIRMLSQPIHVSKSNSGEMSICCRATLGDVDCPNADYLVVKVNHAGRRADNQSSF